MPCLRIYRILSPDCFVESRIVLPSACEAIEIICNLVLLGKTDSSLQGLAGNLVQAFAFLPGPLTKGAIQRRRDTSQSVPAVPAFHATIMRTRAHTEKQASLTRRPFRFLSGVEHNHIRLSR